LDVQFTTPNSTPTTASIEVVGLDEVEDLSENGAIAGGIANDAAFWVLGDGVTTVGNFGGGSTGNAFGINDVLDCYGETESSNGAGVSPFYYGGALVDIGDGTNGGYGCSPNAAGLAPVRWALPGQTVGRLYDPNTATTTDLGFFPGVGDQNTYIALSNARNNKRKLINAANQIACTSAVNADKFATRWESGVFTDFTPIPGQDAHSICIDEAGNVLLETDTHDGFQRGYVNAVDIGGTTLAGIFPQAMSRTGGIVCGYQDDFVNTFPFRWNAIEGYVLIPLPSGTVGAFAYDCNSHGDVVGTDYNGRGFICRNGITYLLIDLVTALFPAGGWTSIDDATLINDNRQIAGIGVHLGVTTAFLFTLPAGSELP
jgi:hypothetical protein